MPVSALLLPIIFLVPGYGLSKRVSGTANRLGIMLNSCWIALAFNWINVAVVRELGIPAEHHAMALVTNAAIFSLIGLWFGRNSPAVQPLRSTQKWSIIGVLIAVVLLGVWRSADITRPLQGYWHTADADQWHHEALPITATSGQITTHGSLDAGGFSLQPHDGEVTLLATAPAKGRLILALQGPLGSRIQFDEQLATVEASMVGHPDEGPVRRYLKNGVAGLLVDIDLAQGETLTIKASGQRLFVMPGADALWALHAEGTLRYVHYYQILNQVENQVWANEMLQDRWATLNQPPGWSPALSTATVLLRQDMPAAAWLFLLVVAFAGLSAVELAHALAPKAPLAAHLLPAAMVGVHGLLMFEPASHNFPDSLYAVAVIAVTTAIAQGKAGWIAALGVTAGLLRWPGVILSTIFLLTWWRSSGQVQQKALGRLWFLVLIGAIIAAIGVATGTLQDLLFILYFETFPEHWHGEFSPARLLPRVPGFYALWTAYTGGGLIIALGFAWFGAEGKPRTAARWLLSAIGLYSLMLATIDHHPTHYFLPLIWVSTVSLICGASSMTNPLLKNGLLALCWLGIGAFLSHGDVGLQPIDDMVTELELVFSQA
jgi:hypothetical protein